MKTLNKKIKCLPLALAMLILFQGCTVYKKTAVTAEQAANEAVKTRIQTIYGDYMKFSYINNENGAYYGIKKTKGELEKTRLDLEFIEKIQIKNKTGSVLVSVLVPIALVIGVGAIITDGFSLYK